MCNNYCFVVVFWGLPFIYCLFIIPEGAAGNSPIFEDFTMREVEATVGQTLLLPCTVRSLGDKVVSWIRSKDLHILTSGRFTFTADNRFESVHSHDGDFWGLRIRGTLLSDTGQYECQVNTDPKMSLIFNLTVQKERKWAPHFSKWLGYAKIQGPKEVYAREGAPVSFTCEVSPPGGSQKIYWLHENKKIFLPDERISSRGGILEIREVSLTDAGRYTCLEISVKADYVDLIVFERAHPEAMQRDSPVLSTASQQKSFHFQYFLIFLLYFPT